MNTNFNIRSHLKPCCGFRYSVHAVRAMISRFIYAHEVETVMKYGEVIRHYPDDKPYESFLFLKFVNERPLHVVVSQIPDTLECIIITCYEPDPKKWDNEFKTKM